MARAIIKEDMGTIIFKGDEHFASSIGLLSSSSSVTDLSTTTCSTTSSAEELDDASSSSSNASSPSESSIFNLSHLMTQLPIKRGLSKFYHGKSQTFGSLANVKSLEDLAKDTTSSYYSYSKRLKFGPKPTIRKRRGGLLI